MEKRRSVLSYKQKN